jgi:putative tricarboxylic transport membrane protein
MLLADRILGFIWLFLGMVLCLVSLKLDLGKAVSPGPGFFPFLTGILLLGLSMIHLIGLLFFPGKNQAAAGKSFWKGVLWYKSLAVVIVMFAYILLLPVLGYILMTFLFLLFLGKAIHPQRWATVILVAVLSAVLSYIVFGLWLSCQFPRGIFGI